MDEMELRHWLLLWRTPGVGARGFLKLLANFGSARAVVETPRSQLQQLGLKDRALEFLAQPNWAGVDQDQEWAQAQGHHIITSSCKDYPALLTDLSDPPPVLYVIGDVDCLGLPQLAMVGSRKPTVSGSETAEQFAQSLSAAGLQVTSGMALGIDAAAHLGALKGASGNLGGTVAVMGTGPDRVYPARHKTLAAQIAENGALVTEYPVGTPVMAGNFPRRNRIISGLSVGTLVVEAAVRSGSLITARMAMEQGREVFAIPGSIHNPMARGCNQLIKQGAKLVETAQDIVEELAALLGDMASGIEAGVDSDGHSNAALEPGFSRDAEQGSARDPDYERLLKVLDFEPVSVDVLVERSGLTADQVSSMLLLLELEGQIEASPGGFYNRLPGCAS